MTGPLEEGYVPPKGGEASKDKLETGFVQEPTGNITELSKKGGRRWGRTIGALAVAGAIVVAVNVFDFNSKLKGLYLETKAQVTDALTTDLGESADNLVKRINSSDNPQEFTKELQNVVYTSLNGMESSYKDATVITLVSDISAGAIQQAVYTGAEALPDSTRQQTITSLVARQDSYERQDLLETTFGMQAYDEQSAFVIEHSQYLNSDDSGILLGQTGKKVGQDLWTKFWDFVQTPETQPLINTQADSGYVSPVPKMDYSIPE
ncbi:MAG: hypothetical protein KKG59_06830 [Nanoarchaeota archaeon]|nr:hypothetical protein [Nanoarchaeota archaeon]